MKAPLHAVATLFSDTIINEGRTATWTYSCFATYGTNPARPFVNGVLRLHNAT